MVRTPPRFLVSAEVELRGRFHQVIVISAMFLCGTFSITSNSRMMYAFARDGAIPGHKLFHKVDEKTKSPVRTGMPPLGYAHWFRC